MGSDKTVVNAARVSFDNDSELADFTDKDASLIRYLAEHNHWSPFAHTSIQLKCKAPIFLNRQLAKHQVGGVINEVSRRYVSSEPEFWFPEEFRGAPVNKKQGSTGICEDSDHMLDCAMDSVGVALEAYKVLLRHNVAPEQARIVLPLNMMTSWYWTGSLVFWARLCNLRLEKHAQKEVQEFAKLVYTVCNTLFPVSFKALVRYTVV